MNKRYLSLWVLILFFSCTRQYHLADLSHQNYRIEKASYSIDHKVATIIDPYKLLLAKTMDEVISVNKEELVKGKPTSTLTNWFADILLDETQKLYQGTLHFAIQNYGGIRVPFLPKGDITVSHVYELMPFDNTMYLIEMRGEKVQLMCDKIAASGGGPVSRGIYFEIAFGKAKNIKINDQPFYLTVNYAVAVPDYIANGGDNMDMFEGSKITKTEVFIRDMLLNHLRTNHKNGKIITPIKDKRIVIL